MSRADLLFRGVNDDSPGSPEPSADPSLVRHILYLGGFGRSTPYLSTSERRETAAVFGQVWETSPRSLVDSGAHHLSRDELLRALKSSSRGRARWPNQRERLRARSLVERHAEHLADYSQFPDVTRSSAAVLQAFKKSR